MDDNVLIRKRLKRKIRTRITTQQTQFSQKFAMADIDEPAKTLIKKWEGLRLNAYQDPIGLWTIGYGHLIGDGKQKPEIATITKQKADRLFDDDFEEHRTLMLHYLKITARRRSCPLPNMNPYQIGAVTSLVFNIGASRFAKSTICRLLADGNMDDAEKQFALWRRAGGKILPGLVKRRAEEASLFTQPYD